MPSTKPERHENDWPALPTETEIYILPDGRVVIADLPAELAPLLTELGEPEPCAIFTAEETPLLEHNDQ
ncbi:MAG: hypothetical protein U0350_16585 [Caldilineaceae bacterium]